VDRGKHGCAVRQKLEQLILPFDSARKPGPRQPGLREIALPGGMLRYSLVRARRRSLALLVDRDGVQARAPRWVSVADVEAFIRDKERWIRERLAEPVPPPYDWHHGARFPWLGSNLTLCLLSDQNTVYTQDDKLCVGIAHLGRKTVRERVLGWIRGQALEHFGQRAECIAAIGGMQFKSIKLSSARKRWGSCSQDGRILLNWRLMLVPPHLIDYVVAHELAHCRELNHSPRFWAVVAGMCPGHVLARKELHALERTLPDI
jgi:predicted metal-dependent hydrolase